MMMTFHLQSPDNTITGSVFAQNTNTHKPLCHSIVALHRECGTINTNGTPGQPVPLQF